MIKDFALPDLGEGLTEGEILQWLVAVGDTVALNQPIIEIETAKAAVEVPSPFAGVVTETVGAEGDVLPVGTVIIRIEDGVAAEAEAQQARTPVLVGYGVKTGAPVRRQRVSVSAVPPVAPAQRTAEPVVRPLAKPPVRKLAKDLGVDLASIHPHREDGVITREEVLQAGHGHPGADERIPVKGVRRLTAEAMVASAFTAPHVTLFLTADVTETMRLVHRCRELPAFEGVRVTPLLFVARALVLACREFPGINASWADTEIVRHGSVDLGIAAATPRGLTVPVVKGADRLSVLALARALESLTAVAKEGRTAPADLTGGTITITNVGVFGVDTGTPILNPGEAAILCVGAVREQPWVHEGALAVRQVMQLSMSVDHRLVDGELGSRALAHVGASLTDPWRLVDWA